MSQAFVLVADSFMTDRVEMARIAVRLIWNDAAASVRCTVQACADPGCVDFRADHRGSYDGTASETYDVSSVNFTVLPGMYVGP